MRMLCSPPAIIHCRIQIPKFNRISFNQELVSLFTRRIRAYRRVLRREAYMASLSQQKSGKAQEKSTFALTFNLLSQYLKERGSFGDIDIGLGMNRKLEEAKATETSRSPATTLNLLPNMESLDETLRDKAVPSSNIKSVDLFTQFVGFSPLNPVEDTKLNAGLSRKSSTTDPGTAPMTIFYGGKMIVFNDFPADKAKEIMALAGKGSPNNIPSTCTTDNTDAANSAVPDLNDVKERGLQVPPKDNDSDLPMARRASLHRFFAKRKERAAARAPYQIDFPSSSKASQTREEEISNLLLLELKL